MRPETDSPFPASFRPARALAQLAAVAAAAALAASAWATGVEEEGYMLDAALWRSEVAGSASGHWPSDGWYRLVRSGEAMQVERADPRAHHPEGDDALYVRVPGVPLKTGRRPLYPMAEQVAQPRLDREYHLMHRRTSFGFTVEDTNGALTYTIRYAGREHVYKLGLPGAPTAIRAIADLDGDAQPDFIVAAGEETYLLLSRPATAGVNRPAAQLWAAHEGC